MGIISFPDFDSWGSGYAKDTVYLALTDLLIMYSVDGGGCFQIVGYSDGSNPPTTIRAKSGTNGAVPTWPSITFAVRKGDYWKVSILLGSGTEYLRVLPIS